MNKTFFSLALAKQAFNKLSKENICFLIENNEDETYEVIDEDTLGFYQNVYHLDYTLLYEAE